MDAVDDNEVATVMVDGARRLVDYALEQWQSGKYGDDREMVSANIKRWQEIRRRIPSKKQMTQLLGQVQP